MTAQAMITKLQKRVAKLHADRKAAFYGEDRVYQGINTRLNHARKELANFLTFVYQNDIDLNAELPKAEKVGYGCRYTRYETLEQGVQENICRMWLFGKWNYYTKQGAALNLKDAVSAVSLG